VPAGFVRIEDGAEPPAQNDDICGLDRDIGAAAECDSYIRLHQSRRIVDSIADHCHARVLLKLADHIRFLGR
jgi:hypothetical protein